VFRDTPVGRAATSFRASAGLPWLTGVVETMDAEYKSVWKPKVAKVMVAESM
jgi:hypothetical protein